MRVFFVVGFLLLSACSTLNGELEKALAFGSIKELNELDPEIDKQLLLRLYESPLYGDDCLKETHSVCRYVYFLSVSTFDEYPDTNIYKLKTEGHIVSVSWMSDSEVDTAKLNLVFDEYPEEALKNDNSLRHEERTVNVVVNTNNILESKI